MAPRRQPSCLLVALLPCVVGAALDTCPTGSPCAAAGEEASLLQHSASGAKALAATPPNGPYNIVIKAPPSGGLTPEEVIAPTCAEGFNGAYAACLGSQNTYLMHIYTDGQKAYCGYQGGWAMTDTTYPDHAACFASPGQSQALFWDSTKKVLMTWDKTVVASSVEQYNGPALNCNGQGAEPCSSSVTPKNRRIIVQNQKSKEMVPDQDTTLNWDASVGYVQIATTTPGKQVSMNIKNLAAGAGLAADVPCATGGSVQDQVSSFPVHGMQSGCKSESGDYYMLFTGTDVTICFPGSAC